MDGGGERETKLSGLSAGPRTLRVEARCQDSNPLASLHSPAALVPVPDHRRQAERLPPAPPLHPGQQAEPESVAKEGAVNVSPPPQHRCSPPANSAAWLKRATSLLCPPPPRVSRQLPAQRLVSHLPALRPGLPLPVVAPEAAELLPSPLVPPGISSELQPLLPMPAHARPAEEPALSRVSLPVSRLPLPPASMEAAGEPAGASLAAELPQPRPPFVPT